MRQIKTVRRHPAILALLAAPAALLALGCSSDHFLGNLPDRDVVDEGDDGAVGGGQDFRVSPALGAPDLRMTDNTTGLVSSQGTSIGDFDGDGFDDFATRNKDSSFIGAPYVQIRYGGARPADDLEAWNWTDNGSRLVSNDIEQESLIGAIVSVGDIDADGYSDFIVPFWHCRGSESRAMLFYGGPERVEGAARMSDRGVLLRDPIVNGGGGCDDQLIVAGLGDFDGDGFDDFMLRHPEDVNLDLSADDPGGAFLFYGRSERLETGTSWLDADVRITSPQSGITAMGDMNGDGRGDLIIGAPWVSLQRSFYWLPGRAERLSRDLDLTDALVSTGIDLAAPMGDLDGDGMQDAILYDDAQVPHLVYGAAGVFDSGIDLAQSSATFTPFAAGANESLSGWEIQIGPAGDLDGDGDDELILSRQVGSSSTSGQGFPHLLALLSGSSQRLSGVVELPTLSSPYPDPDMLLEQVFPIGDLDGDGVDELATSSGYYPNATSDNYDWRLDGAILNIHYGVRGEPKPPR